MRVDNNQGSTIGYQPNSKGEWQEQGEFKEPPLNLEGAAWQWDHREDQDYFSQAGNLFRLMSKEEQQRLFENTARALEGVSKAIQQKHIKHCMLADPAYGEGVSKALGVS
jgi:catalase